MLNRKTFVKTIACAALCITMTAGFCGCGSETSDAPAAAPQVNEPIAVTQEQDTLTNAEAKAEFEKLNASLMAAAKNNDRAAFEKGFRNTDSAAIDANFEGYKGIIAENYPDCSCYIIYGNGTYFLAGLENYLCTGTYPNTKSMCIDSYIAASYVDGEFKLESNNSAELSAFYDECTANVFPEEYNAAAAESRNASQFYASDYTWTDNDVVIKGSVDAKAYLAWQMPDGSVKVLCNVKNGTSEIRNITGLKITMTDEQLGEVFSASFTGSNIAPGKSVTGIMIVDAADIKTGTQQWGSLHISTDAAHN